MPDSAPRSGDRLDLVPTALAAGGDALARDADGRVVFVTGALPGERVRVQLTEARRDFARGTVEEILEASPDRVEPPCPHVARGCGGCDLQHVDPAALPNLKVEIVRDALQRLGRVHDPIVEPAAPLPSTGFRTTIRVAVTERGPGFRRAGAHEIVEVDHCLVAHPLLDELIAEADFGAADEVTLRAGAGTGERLALLDPTADGARLPDDVTVVGVDELRKGRRAWFHDVVDARRWRISAESFFQSRTDGAQALVDAVRRAAGSVLDGPGLAVDAYCGVGLFAGAFSSSRDVPDGAARRFLAVERGASSVADARHNLAGDAVRIVRVPVERLRPTSADLVIADPARTGLGRDAVAPLVACGPRRIVLVSCDPASLGRDARLLAEAGYRLDVSRVVDLFPGTHHVEVVSRFDIQEG